MMIGLQSEFYGIPRGYMAVSIHRKPYHHFTVEDS